MRLYQLKLYNYRRFGAATINLDSKMIAILGPNESGKSSLLDALEIFNNQDRVPAAALTRDAPSADNTIVGELVFRLTKAERATLPYDVPDTRALWLRVHKQVGGALEFGLEPPISRPLYWRATAAHALAGSVDTPWFRQLKAIDEGEDSEEAAPAVTNSLVSLAQDLLNTSDVLSHEVTERLQTTLDRIRELNPSGFSETSRKAMGRLASKLEAALEVEKYPSAQELANAVGALRPLCHKFNDDERNLGFRHDITKRNTYSQAFQNLADLGDLNVGSLRKAITDDAPGRKKTLLNDAVKLINQRLMDDWNQSDLTIDLDQKDFEIRITVAGRDGKQFDFDDRSDGMRMFLALCGFLAKQEQAPRPILLVDELERHLHYDAQADIVAMFYRREDVAQIAYSTHSIGCLPQDLGRGVRVVVPDISSGLSAVDNLWFRGGHGIKPLMAAMGAATLPLQPSRPLIFAEGPTDALLMPSLLREAIDSESLDYLIVSGASHLSRGNIQGLDRSAPHVVYVYDGDQGGSDWRTFLKRMGVSEDRIVRLEKGVVLEDLIEPSLFVDACNMAIREIAHGDYEVDKALDTSDVPETRRVGALAKWCAKLGYRVPGKVTIAETIIDLMTRDELRAERSWIDPRRGDGLRFVHEQIIAKLPDRDRGSSDRV